MPRRAAGRRSAASTRRWRAWGSRNAPANECGRTRWACAIAQAASAQAAAVLQGAVDAARTQLAAAAGAEAAVLRGAQEAVANAVNAQAAGAISDRQTIADATGAVMDAANDLAAEITASRSAAHQANDAVKTARMAVRSTRAANAVATQRPRPDAFVQARAGLRTAQAGLAAARLALAQTELRAPAAGTVVSVNGHVGEAPGQAAGGEAAFITMITFDSSTAGS
jgi:multidrug resistance efflux pump